jgi:hypothetical protein
MAKLRPTCEVDTRQVPERLRRFRLKEWLDAGPGDPVNRGLAAHRRFDEDRRTWAREHGFDINLPYGADPDRDWWAFLKLTSHPFVRIFPG